MTNFELIEILRTKEANDVLIRTAIEELLERIQEDKNAREPNS